MLEQDFLAFINDNHLVDGRKPILLAVSGGLDSMVMAELFHRTHQAFAIAHVNFGLRGEESDADAHFVKNKAEQYGVPFHITTFDTKATAAEQGISIQMAARDLRYNWFAQLIQECAYDSVATAHHQNDVLETLLLNLTRGTGLAGLHGIAPRKDSIIRPLLFATRERLANYANEHALLYREDSSNAEDKYARNRIRHHVVPVLTGLNPAFWQTLPSTVDRLRAAEVLMQAELTRSWQETIDEQDQQIRLSIAKLKTLSELSFRLGIWLKPFGFTETQVEQMVLALEKPVGQVFKSSTHQLVHERTGLVLEPLTTTTTYEIQLSAWPDAPVKLTDQQTLTISVLEKPLDFQPPAEPTVAYLDADRLVFPITIRPWRQGDRLHPLGLTGKKLVSNLLNELKLTRSERERTAVLLTGDQIAWVIGRRIGHQFRIRADTKRIVQLKVS